MGEFEIWPRVGCFPRSVTIVRDHLRHVPSTEALMFQTADLETYLGRFDDLSGQYVPAEDAPNSQRNAEEVLETDVVCK